MESFNTRLHQAEERISKPKDRLFEIQVKEKENEKRIKMNVESL